MSKLKAISGNEIREDIDYNTRGIDPEDKEWCKYGKELCDTLYYNKSEADKEIDKLKTEIEKQKQLRDMALSSAPNILKVMKIIQHQKYKRCLAMAKECVNGEIKLKRVKMRDMNNHQFWQFDNDYWLKWNKRWLELAEEYK